jgi:hypothetical protein
MSKILKILRKKFSGFISVIFIFIIFVIEFFHGSVVIKSIK